MYKIVGGDGKQYGPVSADEVRGWITGGRLNGKSLAWFEGSTEWKTLDSFPEFSDALRTVAGPPPMPETTGAALHPSVLAAWQSDVLARHAEVRLGPCFSRSWKLLTENFGTLFASAAIVWLVQSICEKIPIIGPLIFLVLEGVLYGGLYLLFLKRIRGQSASVGDVFSGFQIAFAQLLLAGLVTRVLSTLAFCCFILPMIYLLVAWVYAVPLVADKRMEFWSAMELSRKIVTRVWFEIFILLIAFAIPVLIVNLYMGVQVFSALLPILQNITQSNTPPDPMQMAALMTNVARVSIPLWLLSKAVALLVLPLAIGARMYAYEDLFGPRQTPAA
jgi:hypothetical protein